ncbi:GntR family transcriptional regulator [Isoptericola sp. NPDC019693]|uniref:GntR family transcriptional regulator n=1 Tax=Isoptericola sp. NPDC019693 TaxID=3364009 RepID=UPI00379B1E27
MTVPTTPRPTPQTPQNPTPPTTPLSAAERAYQHTKARILSGEAAGGVLLSEGDVAAELGISRTPVHEAFLRLDAERLLAVAPRRGAAVVPMAPDEARDVLEMREAVERSTARRALAHGRPGAAVLDELRAHLDAQRLAAAADDVEAFVVADSAFHGVLVRASRNQTAVQFMGLLRDRQLRLMFQHLRVGADEVGAALAEHEEMLAAVERGDADAYCDLLHDHVRRHRGIL